MVHHYAAGMRSLGIVVLAFSSTSVTIAANVAAKGTVRSQQVACELVKQKAASLYGLPLSGPPGVGWWCDFASGWDPSLYVIGLRSGGFQPEQRIQLMGYFAVRKASAEVGEFDINSGTVKPLVKAASGASVNVPDRASTIARASSQRPTVHWDSSTFTLVNLTGGSPIGAVVGYVPGGFVLALIGEETGTGSTSNFLEFRIDATSQAALCAAPVHLRVDRLRCGAQVPGDLPGCRVSQNSQELVLSGGDCDPITVYWDSGNHHPAWWRN